MDMSIKIFAGNVIIWVLFYYLRTYAVLLLATTVELSRRYMHNDSHEQEKCGLKFRPTQR